jgi:hypothetical protein
MQADGFDGEAAVGLDDPTITEHFAHRGENSGAKATAGQSRWHPGSQAEMAEAGPRA